MTKIRVVLGLFVALLLLPSTNLDAQVRSYANEFLALGVGARALSMGNAQVAAVNDVTAAYWNPAGLMGVESTQLGLMHAEWFAGIGKYDYVGLAKPFASGARIGGFSLIRFGVDDIPNTLFLVEPEGSVNYDNLSTFSAADYAALFSYAQQYKQFRVGLNAKIIHRRVGKFATAWGFGIDVGAQYALKENITLGLTIKDLTTTVNAWSFDFSEEEKLALQATNNIIPENSTELAGQRMVFGAAYVASFGEKISLLAEADLDFTFDGKRNVLLKTDFLSIDPHMGLELGYDRFLFLRFGFNNIQEIQEFEGSSLSIQPNAGLGIIFRNVGLDYAFTGLNNVSDGIYSHVISLNVSL